VWIEINQRDEEQLKMVASNTFWGDTELVGFVRVSLDGSEFQCLCWKTIGEGRMDWVEMGGACDSLEQAARLLATLFNMGEMDFTFKESEDGS
jgi:hypothetical protein